MFKVNKFELLNRLSLGKDIDVFAVTGGDCSGKSSAMAFLSDQLAARGYMVIIVPEVATRLFASGVSYDNDGPDNGQFQQLILNASLVQQEILLQAAVMYRDKGKRVVVLCDRGELDGEAYLGVEKFEEMIHRLGFNHVDLGENRYHAVFHLVTAADGAESFFSRKTNAHRVERTLEEARDLDRRTLHAWREHSHIRVIDNSTGFDMKLHRLLVEVCAVLGDPEPVERERKFLVPIIDPDLITVPYCEFLIVQTYLASHMGEQVRVRRRESLGGVSYTHTTKRFVSAGVNIEIERLISEREYETHLESADSGRSVIVKIRRTFFHERRLLELDQFLQPEGLDIIKDDMMLLEVETAEEGRLSLPEFLRVSTEVTGDSRYSNHSMARRTQG